MLLKTKRFLPLMITQFLGALNDNLFKNALLTLVTVKMTAQSDFFRPWPGSWRTNIRATKSPAC